MPECRAYDSGALHHGGQPVHLIVLRFTFGLFLILLAFLMKALSHLRGMLLLSCT